MLVGIAGHGLKINKGAKPLGEHENKARTWANYSNSFVCCE